ncbi:uncharacterized protein LOC128678808 isoform X2 [Plodia interpunctella]|nr:uncharacterized protein LOC128678808 isoform X2 [Plodia interpunctella]
MDVEINTKIPVQLHSKRLKCGLIVVITISTLSVIMSISLAYYHCVNMSLLQKQVDFLLMKMENIKNNQQGMPPSLASSSAEAQMASPHSIFSSSPEDHPAVPNSPALSKPVYNTTMLPNDMFVTHFNGAHMELNLGTQSIIGPWVRDVKVSSPKSHEKIELDNNKVIIKESGLYMIYAQIVYLSQDPCCYLMFARQPDAAPRQLASCSTANDSSARPLARSQISCSTQTVARLYQGDIVNLSQREHDRTVWLRPGYSYFGFIKIAS